MADDATGGGDSGDGYLQRAIGDAMALNAVAEELKKARAKHRSMRCVHEAYAVILEELDEAWDEIKAQKFDPARLAKEFVQVAAMACRALSDLSLLQTSPGADFGKPASSAPSGQGSK